MTESLWDSGWEFPKGITAKAVLPLVPPDAEPARRALANGAFVGYTLNMSATELMREIQRLPAPERERIFEFVLRSQKRDWATLKPPGYFAECRAQDEIEESNWFAARGPRVIVP